MMNSSFGLRLGKRDQVGLAEIEGVLDLMPEPVLLVDGKSKRILAANARALEITAYTRHDLYHLQFSHLVTLRDEGDTQPTGTITSTRLGFVNRHNGSQVEIEFSSKPLPPRGEVSLVTLDLTSQRRLDGEEDLLHAQAWQGLYLLTIAAEQPTIEAGFKTALEGARLLAQADVACLYLTRKTGTGPLSKEAATQLASRTAYLWNPTEHMPDSVPPQDLVLLRSIRVWETGRRPPTGLHRVARAADFKFLATAPIGLPTYLVGLLVLGDYHKPAPQYCLRITQFLAHTFTNLMEAHSIQVDMTQKLDQQARHLRVLEAAAATIQDGLMVFTPSLQTIEINQAAEAIFGYKNKEVHNQPIQYILIGSEAVYTALHHAQEGEPTYHLENVELLRRNGEPFQALVKVYPIMNENQVENILVVVRDLSEQAAYEEKTRQLAQHAELGDAMAVFAHEVRNPINNISTGLQLMEMGLAEEDPQRDQIIRMRQDCTRLADMMKSVLSVARTTDLFMQPMDLGASLKNLLDRLQARLTREGVDVRFQLEPDLPVIFGDPRALDQVFSNLITNAVQAMHGQPKSLLLVKVQADRSAPQRTYVEASIADNGPGIPKELLDKIFQPFFTTKEDGNGLGLPLAKRIITAHKGVINVTSIPGATIFHVVIPASDNEELQTENLSSDLEPPQV